MNPLQHCFCLLALPILAFCQRGVPGGTIDVDLDDEMQDLAWQSAAQYNKDSGHEYHHVPVILLRARSQVVSGVLNTLDIIIQQSGCRQEDLSLGDFLDSRNCTANPETTPLVCSSEIWRQPWLNRTNIELSCKELRINGRDQPRLRPLIPQFDRVLLRRLRCIILGKDVCTNPELIKRPAQYVKSNARLVRPTRGSFFSTTEASTSTSTISPETPDSPTGSASTGTSESGAAEFVQTSVSTSVPEHSSAQPASSTHQPA